MQEPSIDEVTKAATESLKEFTAGLTRDQILSKHTRRVIARDRNGDPLLWHTTKPEPWKTRQQRRDKNKAARKARKANR
jgi:hypothetical protein